MNITVGNLNFNNIKELTSYLENTYEQNRSSISPVVLTIGYDALSTESNTELLQFIKNPARMRVFRINLLPEDQSPKQQAFAQLLTQAYNEASHSALKKNINFNQLLAIHGDKAKQLHDAVLYLIDKSGDIDVSVLKQTSDKIKTLIDNKGQQVPGLLPLLTQILKTYTKGTKDELIKHQQFIDKLLAANETILKNLVHVLTILSNNLHDDEMDLLLSAQLKLEKHRVLLNDIILLFQYPPYPTLAAFVDELTKDSNELQLYISNFDWDPKENRKLRNHEGQLLSNNEVIAKQFKTTQLKRVVANIQNLAEGANLSNEERYKLAQQIIYINAVGKHDPLAIDENIYDDLTLLSRNELRQLSDLLIERLRAPEHNGSVKLKAQLNLLAIMREQSYRATGCFINTTQLLTILLSLNNVKHDLFMEAELDSGQSIALAILAAMQWARKSDATIDVCFANKKLIDRDYINNGVRDFFVSLGINSVPNSYVNGGINYALVDNLITSRSVLNMDNVQQSDLIFIQNKDAMAAVERKQNSKIPNTGFYCESPDVYDTRLDVDSEQDILDSVTKRVLFNSYKNKGRILVIADNQDSISRLPEQQSLYTVEVAYHVPVHKPSRYKQFAAPVIIDSVEQIKAINNAIQNARNNQPVLIITKNEEQAEQLQKQLDKLYNPVVMTSAVSDNERLKWFKESAGLPKKLTIITSSLIESNEFYTDNPNGFLVLQAYPDSPDKIEKFINHIIPKNKPGQYGLIYEENDVLFSTFSLVKSKHDRNNIIKAAEEIHRLRSEEDAVTRYIATSSSAIQRVVLRQFDEWHAFLRLIHSAEEKQDLDAELLELRAELQDHLEKQWSSCLKKSNPHIRRDANKKLQISVLEQILIDYERQANLIWNRSRLLLKEKTQGKFSANSINDMRCQYLDGVELGNELKADKLMQRQYKKERAKEQKECGRYLEAAIDVHGALLTYADGEVEQYKGPFAQSQFKLIARDIKKVLNQSSLESDTKDILINCVENARTYHDLELVLISYFQRTSDAGIFAEKYKMQPIVKELLRIHKLAGLEENQELHSLRQDYLNNVAEDIVVNLEDTLSWAKKENRGFWYWIERSAVKTAAKEILAAADKVKKTTDFATRQAAIKDLYKLLMKHQMQLDDLWIFSFGHKNTRDLIKQTLNILDGLTVIGSDKNELNAEFITACKESALGDAMKNQFKRALDDLEDKNPELNTHPQWTIIIRQLDAIQAENNTVYAIDEMHRFIANESAKLTQSKGTILKHLIHLRGLLRSIWSKFTLDHPDLANESRYFAIKAQKIQSDFQAIDGASVSQVSLSKENNGFSEYFDLVIEGASDQKLFDDFIRYSPRKPFLDANIANLNKQKYIPEIKLLELSTFQNIQLPILLEGIQDEVNWGLFPEAYVKKLKEFIELKKQARIRSEPLESDVAKEVQHYIDDKRLLASLNLHSFTLEQIDGLHDKEVKSILTELYNTIRQQKPWYVNWISLVFSTTSQNEDAQWKEQMKQLNLLLSKKVITSLAQSAWATGSRPALIFPEKILNQFKRFIELEKNNSSQTNTFQNCFSQEAHDHFTDKALVNELDADFTLHQLSNIKNEQLKTTLTNFYNKRNPSRSIAQRLVSLLRRTPEVATEQTNWAELFVELKKQVANEFNNFLHHTIAVPIDPLNALLNKQTVADDVLVDFAPLLSEKDTKHLDLTLFPKQIQQKEQYLIELRQKAIGAVQHYILRFPEAVQAFIFDKELVDYINQDNLNLGLINRLNDPQLKAELTALHARLYPSSAQEETASKPLVNVNREDLSLVLYQFKNKAKSNLMSCIMQKDALDLSLFSPDCQNLMNEMLSLIDAEKALNEGNLPADLNLLSQEMQDTLHDHRLLAPLELTFSAPEPYNLDVIRDLKNKELQDKLMQFHNKIQDLKRTPPPSDSIMSSVISFFTFPVTSLINFFQLPGESEEDLRYQFERLKTSAKTALTDDLEMLITKKQETFFANILAKHNTLSQDLYKARAEIDDYAKGVVTDIVTFHDAQVSAIAASNEQLIQIEQIIVDDLTELDTKMHQELALLNGQIQVLTPELHSDLLVIQDDEREKVVQIEKLINFFKEKINEEGKKPQLMTKRFHSIEALEGFEAHLRNAKRMPCHAIEAIKLHDAYENLLDEDDFPLDFEEEELGNVFRI